MCAQLNHLQGRTSGEFVANMPQAELIVAIVERRQTVHAMQQDCFNGTVIQKRGRCSQHRPASVTKYRRSSIVEAVPLLKLGRMYASGGCLADAFQRWHSRGAVSRALSSRPDCTPGWTSRGTLEERTPTTKTGEQCPAHPIRKAVSIV